jgi:hypothetical protein
MKRITMVNVAAAALVAPIVYFLLSNTGVWAFGGGYARPFNFAGWMQAMADGLPFLKWSVLSAAAFSTMLFGTWYVIKGASTAPAAPLAA